MTKKYKRYEEPKYTVEQFDQFCWDYIYSRHCDFRHLRRVYNRIIPAETRCRTVLNEQDIDALNEVIDRLYGKLVKNQPLRYYKTLDEQLGITPEDGTTREETNHGPII